MASIISTGTTAGTAIAFTGDTSGNLAFTTQNGANTISVPNGTGTIAVNGVSSNIVSGTAVASTSGTSIDFTSIPSWVKRITVMFNGVSTNGTSHFLSQLGTSGGVVSTGYGSYFGYVVNDTNANSAGVTTGFGIYNGNAANTVFGNMIITNISSNTWVYSWSGSSVGGSGVTFGGGGVALSGTLDRVRITTVNGTDAFDAGSVNILYE